MAMKGIERTLWIVIVAIVALVVAVIVLTVFTGGISNFLNFFNPWANQTVTIGACQSRCAALCAAYNVDVGAPPGWAEAAAELKCDSVSIGCDCSMLRPGTGGGGAQNSS
jgi:hypothetical protein